MGLFCASLKFIVSKFSENVLLCVWHVWAHNLKTRAPAATTKKKTMIFFVILFMAYSL
jgi:hypothetical protein